ncbi:MULTISPECIES: hypothetical protein [Pseudomonas]|uniref:hypothetical protein n=1 Tax=Pseudomonas TaxID=286 RepID=UPI000CFB39FB|nr:MULTISPECIES: hypothetical protein [Pseudomonas]PQZ93133.1 hypothetical protein CQ048_05850 [Pseudomonas trivialis]PRB28454.1 hypothetical protein CQ041_05855 [Pseudomonas sp. MYb60]
MRKIVVVLWLAILGVGVAGYGWSVERHRDDVAKAASLVSRHLLAFEEQPGLDLSSYLARGEQAEQELAADLLQMQSADWAGAETKRDAAIAFNARAISVIRTYTRFRMSNLRVGLTQRRLLEDERALALETDPTLKGPASQRLQTDKDKYGAEQREYQHLATAIGMQCEMLLRANDGVNAAFGEGSGLDATTRAFMKKLI